MKFFYTVALLLFAGISPSRATNYFLSPTGSDANSGLSSGAPWLSPNHALNCGDIITAAPSASYSPSNFEVGNWGTVTCPGNNNVAWLACATFDACKIASSGGNAGIYVDHSYWGVQGWEVTITADTFAGCFLAAPSFVTHIPIHHVIFANNVANGCFAGGIGAGASGTAASVDYIAIVGNVVYDAAKTTADCPSNIDIFEPQNSDTQPGTHIYIAGNFSFKAMNTANCNGGFAASDGEGINIDSMNKAGGTIFFTGQVVVDNNITLSNGGRGIEEELNSAGSPNAPAYFRHNTIWGNSADTSQTGNPCSDFKVTTAFNLQAFLNISEPTLNTSCGALPVYAFQVIDSPTLTNHIYQNWIFSPFGNNTNVSGSGAFAFGPGNVVGTDPAFASPAVPGAPSCGAAASVPACMAAVIANFTPTNVAAVSYGYQIPSGTPIVDPLFPQWLCSITNMPAGLITMGCASSGLSSISGGAQIKGATIH